MKVIILFTLTISLNVFAYFVSNPYSPGSGHYAGFEWAQDNNVSSCGGNSQSFINGCEEYLRQKANCDN